MLACAYLEGDRAIACAIRQHHTAPRSVFDLNNLDVKKTGSAPAGGVSRGNNGKTSGNWCCNHSLNWCSYIRGDVLASWSEPSPSGLHAAADASIILRVFYQAANSVLKAVHFVWRISLLYRNDKQDQPKKENKVC